MFVGSFFTMEVCVAESSHFQPLGVTTTTSNQSVVNTSNLIILAVKPLVIKPVLKEIANSVTKDHIIVSVAAGVFIKDIEEVSF